MSAISISKNAEAALQIAQWIRNGKAPVADLQNRLATLCGFVASVREKCIWRSVGGLVATGGTSAIPSSLATRVRWRFPYHSGPYASFLYARFEIAPQDNGTASDPYCTLSILNTAGTLIGTATMHGGSSAGTYADVPINMTGGRAHLTDSSGAFVFLSTDTHYHGVFRDIGMARLQSASVWEVALQPTTENGYVQNTTGTGGPIYDSDRNDIAAMARLLHKRSGTPVFHWCSDTDGAAPSSSTGTNNGTMSASIGTIALTATGGQTGVGALDQSIGTIGLSATGIAGATLAFVADTTPDPVADLGTLTCTITATAGSAAQDNPYVRFWFKNSSFGDVTLAASPTTTSANGWTITWTSIGDGQWVGEATKSTIAVGSSAFTFTLNAYKGSSTYVRVFVGVGYSDEVLSATLTSDQSNFS